ncbi:FkbM family methyltransferase, partial [Streptomyces broussonetiae]
MAMNAIELHSINRWEASFLREEVGGYFAHGVECMPGATVLDVGANIGVFSAAVYERLDGDVRIYAFEPVPPLHATLERNAREFFNGRLTALPYGLASRDDELDFSYVPAATIFSSSSRDQGNIEAERRRVTASVVEMIRQGGLGPVLRRVPAPVLTLLVGRKLRVMRRLETHRVEVRPLSSA